MRVLIELPTWLGDTIMAGPAIENIISYYNDSEIVFIGSSISISVFENHPLAKHTLIYKKNYLNLLIKSVALGRFDVFFSFRESIRSKFFKSIIQSKLKYQFSKCNYKDTHQVLKYNNFINDSLGTSSKAGKLTIYIGSANEREARIRNRFIKGEEQLNNLNLLGINPGASYGNSKCWNPKKYAKVAAKLSEHYDILIFGSALDEAVASDIEQSLIKAGVKNYKNLAGKTSIAELIKIIASLDMFITGDSGPMHIAAAFQIPTVSIFGPTRDYETSQWMNKKNIIVKKNLSCQPCMERLCPLGHHNCMQLIEEQEIVSSIKLLE